LPPYVQLDHSQQYFGAASKPLPSAIGFSQHADEHRSERPILLPVDQELGEVVLPRLSDGEEMPRYLAPQVLR
jgi:hypothetical protein